MSWRIRFTRSLSTIGVTGLLGCSAARLFWKMPELKTVDQPTEKHACCDPSSVILYPTPKDAMKAPRERIAFVTATNYNMPMASVQMQMPTSVQMKKSDAVFTIDIDPNSATYCQPISKVELPKLGDEVHHSGWNACASCFGKAGVNRRYLICPTLITSRVYVIDTFDPKNLKLAHTVHRKELEPLDATFLHTTHCLGTGEIMISSLGDNKGNNKGQFILLDKDFKVKGLWHPKEEATEFNYGFWYQPRLNVMMSSEWGSPSAIKHGFDPKHIEKGYYSRRINIWDWTTRKRIQSIELPGEEGSMGFEIRFLHDPDKNNCFMGTLYGGGLYHIYKEGTKTKYEAELVARCPPKKVKNWKYGDSLPAMLSDVIISMDDKYLYASLWLHGKVLQYDISDPHNVKLVGEVNIGGLLHNQSGVTVDEPGWKGYDQTEVKGRKIEGGPHMLQLSLDGKRLYVTTNLTTPWDEQFYPELVKKGGAMLMMHVDTEKGGLELDPNFLVDFGDFPGGDKFGAHEMRWLVSTPQNYTAPFRPSGDCTSDIFL
ncbi:Selenium-binding protein 1 [Aphelenchoides besseyi]|nr:Selenium-binding protein 1 [Aphelenchoides besseyi]